MTIQEHVEALRGERDRLRADVSDAEATVKDIKSQLKRVDDALAALTGSRVAKKRGVGDGVKTAEVIAHMRDILQAGALRSEELKEQVSERLKNRGKTRTGYALRFKQALKDSAFSLNGELVALADRVAVSERVAKA